MVFWRHNNLVVLQGTPPCSYLFPPNPNILFLFIQVVINHIPCQMMQKIQLRIKFCPINKITLQVICIDLCKSQEASTETVRPILSPLCPLHRNKIMTIFVVVVNLVAVMKVVTKDLMIIKPFGCHLPAWSLVHPLHIRPLQIIQHPVLGR